MLDVRPLEIEGLLEIRPKQYGDERGFFSEVWNSTTWQADGIDVEFVQDNHSYSAQAGVLRGLHYQLAPCVQTKLVRVVRGRIFDVAVDIRPTSPSFGKWLGVELSAVQWNQLLVPGGFAHGFLTLEPECEVLYKVSAPYNRDLERAIRFDDPQLGIVWPLEGFDLTLADRDRAAPTLAEVAHELC